MALVGAVVAFMADTADQFFIGLMVLAAGGIAWVIGAAEGEK